MIFKTNTDDFGRMGLGLNNSFKGMFNGDFFKKQNLLSDSDISAIKAYNAEIDKCVTSQTAFNRTMLNTSQQAQNVVAAANGNKVALEGMTKASKAAELGMKALSIAGNMIAVMVISWVLSEAISWLNDLAHAEENARKRSEELTSSYETEKKDIDDSIAKYKELSEKLNDSSLSTSEVKSIKEQLLSVQNQLNEKYGAEATQIDLVNGKYDEQIKKLDALTKKKASDYVSKNYKDIQADQKYVSEKVNLNKSLGFKGSQARPDDYSNAGFDLKKYLDRYDKLSAKVVNPDGQYGMTGDVNLVTNGTRQEIYDQLSQLFQDLSNDFGNSNEDVNKFKTTISGILEDSFDTDALDSANDRIKKYAQAEILSNDDASASYNNLVNAVDNYNTALSSGKGVDDAKQKLLEAKQAAEDSTKDITNSGKVLQDVYNSLDNEAPIELQVEFGKNVDEDLQQSYDDTINRFKSDTSDSSSKELDSLNKQLDEQTQSLADAKENLQNEYDKISDWGLDDYADQIKNNTIQTKFGNVDMDKRTIIHWSDELKHTYADALASWDYDPEIGSIDTVFGGSERFGEELNGNGWEVAFTPILPDGTFLSKDTVEEYINSILEEAYADDGKVTEDELTAIDAQGRQVGNTFVQGIFAGIDDSQNYDGNGNWAETVGRLMHFVGSFGAKQLADQGIDSANKKLEETKKKIEEVSKGFDDSQKIKDFFNTEGINTDEEINEFNEVTKGINDADKAIQTWNEHKKETNETPISFTDALNSSKYKDIKEKLLELAKAGQLTPYTISSTKEYNALLEDTGLSAEKAYKKIMKIAQSDMSEADWKTTLTNARSQIAEIKNLKKELKKNGESSDFMDAILEKFPQLIGYLGDQKGMQEQLNELQKEQEDVANNAYMHMVEDSESYYSTLKRKEAERLKTTSNTINKIVNGNAGLVKALGGYYKVDLSNYASIAKAKATLEKNLITNLASAWSKFYKVQVNAQTGLAEVHNDSTTVPSEYLEKANGDYGKAVSMMTKEQNKQKNSALKAAKAYNEAIKGFNSIIKNPGVSTNVSSSGGNSKSKKAKATYQKFSQTIDWCAQTLKKLSAQIDNVQAKLNNTSALSKQISYYKKLVKSQNELAQSYEKTENKYNKVYKNALKKLSKSDQKKVRDGSYTIEHFKGKAKSGKKSGAEKRYNNIQKALTARDNYLEASTSSENEKQKLAEYRESLASLRWENVTTKVEKLNNQISILDTRMSNVSGYVAKNKVLNEQLDLQKKIVDKQQEAYKANQKDANSYYKKISSKYKKNKNSDGAIKTTGVKDKKQLSYIKMYNAYLKQQKTNLVELKQAQEDYYNTIINAKQTAAENIKTDYDNRISLVDAKRQELESKASLAEANGQVVSGSYYKLIANNSKQRLEKLNAEKDKLEAQMQGVRKYSDLWYTLQANIISVDQSIADETKNAVDNINKQAEALKNLADAKNDYLNSTYDTLDWINSFADEDDYYDDDGNYTDKGYAVMHNKLAQIEIKKQESENYEKAISDLDKLYYSKDSKLSEAEWLKQRNELDKSYQQTRTDIYNQEKELADIRNKQLDKQSDKLKDIIDLKKKSLDADKSEYDYQKSVAEKTKSIADLQKQLAMLEGNNSEDAMAERQKLQKELSDAKDDLKDTQYDKYLDRLEDAFSDLEDRFDKLIEEMKKEDVSTTTENIKTDVEDNNSSRAESGNKEILGENGLQVFDKTANSLITAGTNIETKVDDVNTKLDKTVEAVIKDSKEDDGNGNGTVKTTTDLDKVLGKYDAKNKSQDTKGKSSITKYLASQGYKTKSHEGMLDLVNGILNSDYVSGMNGDDRTALSKITTKDQLDGNKDKNATANKDLITKSLKYVKANEFISKNAIVGKKKRDEYSKANRHIYDKTGGKILSEKNLKKLAGILNVSYDSKKIYDALKACGYSQGGIVGKAIRVNGDDGIATLKTGEAVLTPAQTDALVALRKNLVPLNNFMSAIKTNVPNIQRATTATTTIGDVSFEFNLPNVVDSETLIKTIQTDTRVQKTLQNATVGQLNGSSKFKVNRL